MSERRYIDPDHAVACQAEMHRLWEYLLAYHAPDLRDGARPDQIVDAAIRRLDEMHAYARATKSPLPEDR